MSGAVPDGLGKAARRLLPKNIVRLYGRRIRPSRSFDEPARNALLTGSATRLIAEIQRLGGRLVQPRADRVQETLAGALRLYQAELQAQGVSAEHIMMARSWLCITLDQAVLGTPWGHASDWQRQTLLQALHGEADATARQIFIMKRLRSRPEAYGQVIEFCYLCICALAASRSVARESLQASGLRLELERLLTAHCHAAGRSQAAGRPLRHSIPPAHTLRQWPLALGLILLLAAGHHLHGYRLGAGADSMLPLLQPPGESDR